MTEKSDVQAFKLRLPRGEHEALKAIAFATGTSINELIHQAVQEYLAGEGRRIEVRHLMEETMDRYEVALDKLKDL